MTLELMMIAKPKHLCFLIFLAIPMTTLGCSEVGGRLDLDLGTDMASDMAAPDQTSMEPDMAVEDMREETCTPTPKLEACMGLCGEQPDGCGGNHSCGEPLDKETVCADTCGMQPDGCGGMLECDPCTCENGQPVQPTCGPCNLGAASCNEQDTFSCLLPPVPDIETLNCELDIIYVSSAYTGTTPLGSQENPFKTLNDGLSAASANGSRLVIATNQKRYEENETLIVTSGTSILGGYNEDWRYSPTKSTELFVGSGEVHSMGIEAQNITLPTLIANISLETAKAPVNGNNYGIYANTANRLVIDNSTITAGEGGVGAEGSAGGGQAKPGKPGADGLPGQRSPGISSSPYDCPTPDDIVAEIGSGGFLLPCEDPYTKGGKGGSGGCTNTDPNHGGASAANGYGGDPGTETSQGGTNGQTFVPWGTNSIGGEGRGGTSGGSIEDGFWVSTGQGENGNNGRGGRGGGGGGGAYKYQEQLNYSSGPLGGEGGGGGCAGIGGEGGYGGGSSFGMLIIDSFGLEIKNNSTIVASNGGTGGIGQTGGTGGKGGVGGMGTDQACTVQQSTERQYSNCFSLGYKSGDGGDGSDGTPGGPGGGGAGGDSYGIYCHESTIGIDTSTTIESGLPGTGGPGGVYPAGERPDPNENGESGVAAKTQGCN